MASTACSGVSSKGATKRSWPRRARLGANSDIADPRIEYGIEQVDDQAHDHVDQHHDRDDGDDGRVLALVDGAEREVANPGHVEDALSDDGPGHQGAEVDAEVGRDRDE